MTELNLQDINTLMQDLSEIKASLASIAESLNAVALEMSKKTWVEIHRE